MPKKNCGTCKQFDPVSNTQGRCCWKPEGSSPYFLARTIFPVLAIWGRDCVVWEPREEGDD